MRMVIVLLAYLCSMVWAQQSGVQTPGQENLNGLDETIRFQINLYRQRLGDDGGRKNLEEFRQILLESASQINKTDGKFLHLQNDTCIVMNNSIKCGLVMQASLAPAQRFEVPAPTAAEKRSIEYSGTNIFIPLVRLFSYVALLLFAYRSVMHLVMGNLSGVMQNIIMLILIAGTLWVLGR